MRSINRAVHPRSGPSRSRGVAAVEFVITLPLLLLLMLVGAELGRAFVEYSILSHSVRNSARYVSENAIAGDTGVINLSVEVIRDAKNLAVYGKIGAGGIPRLRNFQTAHVAVVDAGNNNIRITADYPFQHLAQFGIGDVLIPPPLTLHIAVTMRAIS